MKKTKLISLLTISITTLFSLNSYAKLENCQLTSSDKDGKTYVFKYECPETFKKSNLVGNKKVNSPVCDDIKIQGTFDLKSREIFWEFNKNPRGPGFSYVKGKEDSTEGYESVIWDDNQEAIVGNNCIITGSFDLDEKRIDRTDKNLKKIINNKDAIGYSVINFEGKQNIEVRVNKAEELNDYYTCPNSDSDSGSIKIQQGKCQYPL